VSPILVAILVGLAIRNTVGLPGVYEPGVRLGLKRVLRVGVALLGVQLSLGAAGAIGLLALPVVAGCIVAALALASVVGRSLALPPRLATLIAVGTAICGNTAIIATAPLIGADDDETSYAVGCITVFGLLALLTYPFVSHGLFAGDAAQAGLFLGTAIHDTAQVAGAGLLYLQQYGDSAALETATVTKLVRNLCMLAVLPGIALLHRRSGAAARGARLDWRQAVPGFVFAFVALTALRTLGDLGERPFGVLAPETWRAALDTAGWLSAACLTVAMASVGLGTNLTRLRSLGLRPLAAGLAIALAVGAVAFGAIRLLAAAGAGVL
ncbi:MAG TPA: putative sulfate exporter family transporter, partial [Myxococcota bacterium]|nr:putative sulfate exporter family transporter [Myxococcota bacterium]